MSTTEVMPEAGEYRGPDALIGTLNALANPDRPDRAALAALRRGLGREPGEITEMCRYVDRRLPLSAGYDKTAAYYLVASLFGWHPAHRAGKNLGGSFAELATAQRTDRIEPSGVERRFIALLDAHQDDLPNHLRHTIGLLRSKEIPLDYAQLLRDILYWDHPDRFVQRRWSWAFWSRAPSSAAELGVDDNATRTTETTTGQVENDQS